MVFTVKNIEYGVQWNTSFEHDGKSYIADVCHPLDRPWNTEGFIGEVGEDGYLILGNTICVEVEEVSKQCLETLCKDFMSGNIDKYVRI